MMEIFFEEVPGALPPLWRESYRVGYAREFEDGVATSLKGGVFGDIAALCGPLETQGHKGRCVCVLCTCLGYFLKHICFPCLLSCLRP